MAIKNYIDTVLDTVAYRDYNLYLFVRALHAKCQSWSIAPLATIFFLSEFSTTVDLKDALQ